MLSNGYVCTGVLVAGGFGGPGGGVAEEAEREPAAAKAAAMGAEQVY